MRKTTNDPRPLSVRFEEKIASKTGGPNGDCWVFASRASKGHRKGGIALGGRTITAARASYMVYVGDIPCGLHILHSCDYGPCVNPNHLRAGTRSENRLDYIARGSSKRLGPFAPQPTTPAPVPALVGHDEMGIALRVANMRASELSVKMIESGHPITKQAISLWVNYQVGPYVTDSPRWRAAEAILAERGVTSRAIAEAKAASR